MNWDIISRKLLNSDDILRDEHGTLALEHKMKTIHRFLRQRMNTKSG